MKTDHEDLSYLLEFHTCELCGYKTKSQPLIEAHIGRCKMKPENYFHCEFSNLEQLKCHICSFESDVKLPMDRHISFAHGELDHLGPEVEIHYYGCNKCSFKTYSILVLAHHLCHNYHKAEGTVFEKLSFESVIEVDQKCKSVTKCLDTFKRFHCAHCSYKTKWKRHLKEHFIVKHGKLEQIEWLLCDLCPYKTKLKSYLKRHILEKHGAPEDVKWFECDRCSYKTKRKFNLKSHIMVKHGKPQDIKWFACDHCSYKAKWKSHVNRHKCVFTKIGETSKAKTHNLV